MRTLADPPSQGGIVIARAKMKQANILIKHPSGKSKRYSKDGSESLILLPKAITLQLFDHRTVNILGDTPAKWVIAVLNKPAAGKRNRE